MFEHITSFQKKLDLFNGQFSNFVNRIWYNDKKITACGDRFLDFRKLEMDFNIFCDPFNTVVNQSPDHLQPEPIDLQSEIMT